jgi:hypothetical protein
MRDDWIPGYDIPVEDVLLLIAEHSSQEIWDWTFERGTWLNPVDELVIRLIPQAAIVAAEKNPLLFEKLKETEWEFLVEEIGDDQCGDVGVIAAIYSDAASFKKILDYYHSCLDRCAVAAAKCGRIDNLEVIFSKGYDVTSYPDGEDDGSLADIAELKKQTATVDWLLSKGVKKDF